MTKEPNSGASAPEKSKLDLAKEAQTDLQTQITAKRLELIALLLEHKSIGGKDEDQTEESLLEIIDKYPKGIAYRLLQSVFPDTALAGARKALKNAGRIDQDGYKGEMKLLPKAA